jgi:hypothetical protein
VSRIRFGAATLAVIGALAVAPAALGSGGGGSGGSGGSGGGCAPLTMPVKVIAVQGHYGLEIQPTIQNCTSVPEPVALTVTVPGSTSPPFTFSSGGAVLQPGRTVTMFANPIGVVQPGATYTVIGVLTRTGATPAVLSTIATTVTIPTKVLGV